MGINDSCGIDTNGNPAEDALLDAITEIDVVEHRIGGLCFLGEDAVVNVEEERLLVGGVGLE